MTRRLLTVFGLILIAGGCAGNGCSCMGPLPNGFPPNERHPGAIQARLTASGVAFMENNAPALVNALVPGGLNFPVPPSCGGNPEICCGSPPGTCEIQIDVNPKPGDPPRLELDPLNPPGNRLGVKLRARVKTKNPMPFKYDTGWFTVSCTVTLDTEDAGPKSVTVTTHIDFTQDPTVGTTRLVVGQVTLADLDSGDIELSGGFGCSLADFFKGFFLDQVKGQFEEQIKETLEEQLCKECEITSHCAPFATCNADKVCEINDAGGKRCLQEIGASGRLWAATLFASLSPGQEGAMDVYDVAGGYASTNGGGLSLGVLGGAIPADMGHHPCVPPSNPPTKVTIPESSIFKANTGPAGPFDIGIGVHEYYLNLNAWAAYESGFLCANIGTRSIDLLNSDTFSILVPSLIDLLHGQSAPLIMALRPQKKPVITLGAGTFTISPSGEKKIDDPLLTIALPQLDIDFYAMVDERYVRLFTLTTDVTLPIGLDVNDMGQIVPVLGDLEQAFQNISVKNTELLIETPEQIADRFPAVLQVALPFVADALGAIDVPEFAGLEIKIIPGGLTSVENRTMLAIFGRLAVASGKPSPRVDTSVEVVSVTTPPTAAWRAERLDRSQRPVVELAFGGTGRNLEWQYKIDGGLWSPYTTSPRVSLSRDVFWLQGRHEILVRAREVGQPETTDPEPARAEIVIDSIAPNVALTDEGEVVRVDARDAVTPAERLRVAFRAGDGAWVDLGAAPAIIPVGELDPAELEVRVVDEAGNVTFAGAAVVGFHGRVPGDGGCGCRAAGRSGGRAALGVALLALVALVPLARRRWRRAVAPFLATAVTLGVAACGGGATGGEPDAAPGDTVVVPGNIGRWSDIAAGGGRVVVSAYEEKFGDLVVSDVGEAGAFSWKAVDGVPDGPVVLDPNGYRGGVKAPGEDVGGHTSIALVGGKARVAYQDLGRGALRYAAEGEGKWSSHEVDPGPGAGARAGLYASLSIDASGVPGIAYMVHAVDDGAGGKRAQLRWARATSTSPSSAAEWSVSIVAEVSIPCAGLCGDPKQAACVESTNTCQPVDSSSCGSCTGDRACVGGSCVAILPAPGAVDLPEGTGLFASAGRLLDGRPVIAFYDRGVGDLMLAVLDEGGAWQLAPLDAARATDTGQWAQLAISADGTVHVAYQDALGDRLLYRTWAGGVAGPIEVIDDGARNGDRPHPVGASAALVIDAQGGLAVAYQDAATSDLLFARRNGDGTWTRADLMAGAPGYGFFTAASADESKVWVSNYVYDREVYPPGELRVTTLP